MTTHTFDLTDTRTGTPATIAALSYDDATKTLTINCTGSVNIPTTPANGEAVLLGLLQDIEVAAINKTYDPDSPISEPSDFSNPDFTQTNNFQYQERTDNEEETLVTVRETQTAYAFKFLGWFKATVPSAANAVNDDD
jgi:hypothetical protein